MTTTLQAQPRVAAGKSEANRLRREGKIPAITYGKSLQPSTVAVSPKDVLGILHSELGRNTVIALELEGKRISVMIKDFAYHPVTRELEHVDFIAVRPDEQVDVEVPLVSLGKAAGIAQGGVLRMVYRLLPVRCVAAKVPAKIEVDISPLNLGDHFSTKDIKVPEGVVIRLPQEQTIVAIVAPEKEKVEEVAPVAGAAAPAAGAAAPAAGAAPAADAKKPEAKKEEKKK